MSYIYKVLQNQVKAACDDWGVEAIPWHTRVSSEKLDVFENDLTSASPTIELVFTTPESLKSERFGSSKVQLLCALLKPSK